MAEKQRVLTVSQLNMYVRSLLESSVYLNDIVVTGEISNFTDHYRTGHMYLSLKDETGLIRAVMFRQYNSRLTFKPQNGMMVACRGKVSLYERDGQYQLYIMAMKPLGEGDLNVAYEQLKAKLEKEGLFDKALKKPIPRLPRRIAVITSPTGAAVQDILNILSRRYPVATVVMCPVTVQGDTAEPELIQAVKDVNAKKCADVIIIGRGGGSIEDLWAFNSEALARTIRASDIPVISAVGHETDFTICDYAADLRAPTPSGAAELATPDKTELLQFLQQNQLRCANALKRVYTQKKLMLQALLNKQCMANATFLVDQKAQTLDFLSHRLQNGFEKTVSQKQEQFVQAAAKLDSLSPLQILLRGYSIVQHNGEIVRDAGVLQTGDRVQIRFATGQKDAVIADENSAQ